VALHRAGTGGDGSRTLVGPVFVVDHLELGDHVCGFVEGPDDLLDVVEATVSAALCRREMVVVFTDMLTPVELTAGVAARGVPIDAAERAGQVRIASARETYLRGGRFEPHRLLADLEVLLQTARAEGFLGVRLVGDMGWVQDMPPGIALLLDYEAQANRLYMDAHVSGICLYDRRRVDRDIMAQVVCAHPATATPMPGGGAGWRPLLRIRRTWQPYGVVLTGEADYSNRLALAAALDAVREALPDSSTPLVIDVSGLQFVDVATTRRLARLAADTPRGIQIVGADGLVARVLDLFGLGGRADASNGGAASVSAVDPRAAHAVRPV
jgi:anti-anti-sigma regulatory factor